METTIGLFLLISGIIIAIGHSRNEEHLLSPTSYFIFGIGTLLLIETFSKVNGEPSGILSYTLISVLALNFLFAEILKSKTQLFWNIIPILFAIATPLIIDFSTFTYMEYQIESNLEIQFIAILSALTPTLTHLGKLGISNLIIRFGNIQWAENEENYLEGLVSYAFIGGVAALGNFLLGPLGLIIAGTFYLSAALIAQNKLGLKNNIILTASSAIYLLVATPIVLHLGSFEQLNFLRGEVIEGAFVAGFLVIVYHLFIKLARFNPGKWSYIFTLAAISIPLIAISLVGFAYTQFERLGGVLSLAAILISMSILSITFSLFKNAAYIPLKMFTLGLILLLIPYIKPTEQTSNLDLSALGIENNEDLATTKTKELSIAEGSWTIAEENSKVFFELGPEDGRTKGEFKSITGKFVNNTEQTKIEVTLPVKKLTTYISPRDKELMGSGYFDEENYPNITFLAKDFTLSNEHYTVIGDFTMMGITEPLELKLKILGTAENDGQEILIMEGNSELDRTKFGQSPSSKIGNVVEFKFEVQLNKN